MQMTKQTLPNGKLVPAISVLDASVTIPKDKVTITIKGNWVAEIANAFKSFFLGTVIDQMQRQIKAAILKELPPNVNKAVSVQNGVTELYPGIDIDWTINAAPAITASDFNLGMKGLMFPKG